MNFSNKTLTKTEIAKKIALEQELCKGGESVWLDMFPILKKCINCRDKGRTASECAGIFTGSEYLKLSDEREAMLEMGCGIFCKEIAEDNRVQQREIDLLEDCKNMYKQSKKDIYLKNANYLEKQKEYDKAYIKATKAYSKSVLEKRFPKTRRKLFPRGIDCHQTMQENLIRDSCGINVRYMNPRYQNIPQKCPTTFLEEYYNNL